MRVIGLSGPQGGGKSTLLNGLKERGYMVDDFKVSRAVQEALGWESLENVLESVDTMKEFQQQIVEQKFKHDMELDTRMDVVADVILTERTFADIAAYTQLWTWELVHARKWTVAEGISFMLPFVQDCARRQHVYSANLILPSMPHVQWQADPHRAKQEHTQFIEETLDAFFIRVHPQNVPTFRITKGSVEGRINQVNKWIEAL